MELRPDLLDEWGIYEFTVPKGTYVIETLFKNQDLVSMHPFAKLQPKFPEESIFKLWGLQSNRIIRLKASDDGFEKIISRKVNDETADKNSPFSKLEEKLICDVFSNLDLKSDSDILRFCNCFGLPTPHLMNPTHTLHIEERTSQSSSVVDFGRCVVFVRNVVALTHESQQSASMCDWVTVLQCILYFLFIADSKFFPMSNKADQNTYWIDQFRRSFYLYCQEALEETGEVPSNASLIYGFLAETDKFIKRYKPNTSEPPWKEPWQINPACKELVSLLCALVCKDTTIDLKVQDPFGQFTIEAELWRNKVFSHIDIIPSKIAYQGKLLLCHIMNYHMSHFHNKLIVSAEGHIVRTVMPRTLLDVMFAELYMVQGSATAIAKCENKTCGRYFTRIKGRKSRIYCCDQCKNCVASRNMRKKIKSQ